MEEQRPPASEDEPIDLGKHVAAVWARRWTIAGVSLAAGIATLLFMFTKPNMYSAQATIAPALNEGMSQANRAAFFSMMGFPAGETAGALDLEALLKSDDLAVRVFGRHEFWPVLYPKTYDPATKRFRSGRSFLGGLFGGGKKADPEVPGEWDAIRAARGGLTVSLNRRTGTITVAFESRSPEGSAEIVRAFLEEAKNRLQEEALERARKNKKFIEEQIARTVDALTRERLYTLYGYETEREMLAHNREQFAFRVIDPPRVPDRKSRPARGRAAVLATLLAAAVCSLVFAVREGRRA